MRIHYSITNFSAKKFLILLNKCKNIVRYNSGAYGSLSFPLLLQPHWPSKVCSVRGAYCKEFLIV